jgi:hypothetical protein
MSLAMLLMASRRSDVADKDEDTRPDPFDGAKAAAELIAAATTTAIAAAFMVLILFVFVLIWIHCA